MRGVNGFQKANAATRLLPVAAREPELAKELLTTASSLPSSLPQGPSLRAGALCVFVPLAPLRP